MSRPSLPLLSRRTMITGALAAAPLLLPSRLAFAQSSQVFRPEDFGARGDGRSNDTAAFVAMSRAVERAGGGAIVLSRRTYRVGLQARGGPSGYAFEPSPVLALSRLTRGITIDGGGAVLRAAPGLRYGTFEPRTLRPLRPRMPHFDVAGIATPYRYMVLVERSAGPVVIGDLELDGNIEAMEIGGEWGDVGRQLEMGGLCLRDNRGAETVSSLYTHHHGQDGLLIDGPDAGGVVRRIESVRSEYNGRQGCSLVGGREYVFRDCVFAHTGRAALMSAPGGGVDIESERGKSVRDVRFIGCRFEDNAGCGLVADSGPSRGASFDDCTFVGTTTWAAWPSKPGFAFNRCTFAGASVRPFASERASEATQFAGCLFTDDPRRSPTGAVYLSRPQGPIVDAGGAFKAGLNVAFRGCRFELDHGATLPWTVGSIYQDCTMRQAGSAAGYPRGVYRGTNRITGKVDLYSSTFEGPTYLNGTRL